MLRKVIGEREMWFLTAITLIYFYPPLFGNQTFFFRDLYMFYYPQRLHLVEMVRTGTLPLWDPYLHGGMPFLGEVANLVLYPTVIFYLLLPSLTAFNLEIVFHIWFAGFACYLLTREMGMSRAAAFAAAAIYSFCGYTLSSVNLFIRLLALPYIPLLLFCWHRFLKQRQPLWFAISVISALLFMLTGTVENFLITSIFIVLWSCIYSYEIPVSRRITFWLLVCGLSSGLALVQILPSFETVAQSVRAEGYRYHVFSAWSLHPLRMPELILPDFFGSTDKIRAEDYWGIQIEKYFPYILSIYFGLVTLVLCFRSLLRSDSASRTLTRRMRFFLMFFATTMLLLAIGYHLPGFSLVRWIPLADHFRYPLKFLSGALLPVALLAGVGLDQDFGNENRISRRAIFFFWIVAALLTVFFLALRYSDQIASAFLSSYFQTKNEIARKGLAASLVHALAIWLLAALFYQYRRVSNGRWPKKALACLILLDLAWAGLSVNPFAPREFFNDIPESVPLVRTHLSGGRLFRIDDPPNFRYYMPKNDVREMNRWNLETLKNYTGAFYHIPLIFHENYDGLAPRRIARLYDELSSAGAAQKQTILQASAVSLILAAQDVYLPGWDSVGVVRAQKNRPFYLYRNENSHGRSWLVTRIEPVKDSDQAWGEIMRPGFDVYQKAAVENPGRSLDHTCPGSFVKELARSNNRVQYSVTGQCDALLVFSEAFYPGWKCTIDGKSAKLLRANYAFSAVFVPPGTHTIERSYRPLSVVFGAIGSLLSAILFLLLIKSKYFRVWLGQQTMPAKAEAPQEV